MLSFKQPLLEEAFEGSNPREVWNKVKSAVAERQNLDSSNMSDLKGEEEVEGEFEYECLRC